MTGSGSYFLRNHGTADYPAPGPGLFAGGYADPHGCGQGAALPGVVERYAVDVVFEKQPPIFGTDVSD